MYRRTETSVLAAIMGMGSKTFLRVPWTKMAEQIRAELPEFADKAISVQGPIAPRTYPMRSPVTVVLGAGAPQEPDHVIVKIDLRYPKKEIQAALARIYDHVTRRMPQPYLSGRDMDWRARLDWLGMYRLRRARYSYLEIAAIWKDFGQAGELEVIARQIKREVLRVPGIFTALFPFHALPKSLGGTGKASEPRGYFS